VQVSHAVHTHITKTLHTIHNNYHHLICSLPAV
jgi:hypothetical protein